MKRKIVYIAFAGLLLSACHGNGIQNDASGTFEADEVVVSSEISGKIIRLSLEEGDTLAADSIVGLIDTSTVNLQKEQVEASMAALQEKTLDVSPQVKLLNDQLNVQQSQLSYLQHEQQRISNLLKADAATRKQLDDINSQIEVLEKQMAVTRQQIAVQTTNVATQNRGILSEKKPLAKQAAQIRELLQKARIRNPLTGTVLTKYAEAGEFTTPGKALYKIANLSELNLRAYVTGSQLPQIKLGQEVKVFIDSADGKSREYPGKIIWISDEAEFTPKTIQTRDERANLVYAIKVRVKNDGYLKIGMYGEVKF